MNNEEINIEQSKVFQSNGDKLHMQIQQLIGTLIFQERQKRGIRQASLAARLDLSQEQIDMLETGCGKMQWSVIYRVLDYLHRKFEIILVSDGTEKNEADLVANQ